MSDALAAAADEIVARYPVARSALLPLLHLVRAERGRVDAEGVRFCARRLGLTVAQVHSVASFYAMFRTEPLGEHQVTVCTTTVCAVLGGDAVLAALREHAGGPDGVLTVEAGVCVAACDHAPVVTVNGEFFDRMTPHRARTLVDDLRAGRAVWPSRGAGPLCTVRQNARLLAGLPDPRTYLDDDPADAYTDDEPSTAGVRLAREHGWHAP